MKPRIVKNAVICSLALALLGAGAALADDENEPRTIRVDCGQGQSLNEALAARARVLVVEFTGTCAGSVTIARGDVTLRGADASATVTGGPVLSEGYSRVTLEGFTVRDTPPANGDIGFGVGIRMINTHEVTLRRLTLLNIGNAGLEVNGSTGNMSDISVTGAVVVGISVSLSSEIIVRGTVQVTRGGNGLIVSEHGELAVNPGASLIMTDNQGTGLISETKGHIAFRNDSHLTADRNAIGIQVVDVGSFVYDRSQIEVAGNRSIGVQVGQLSDWTIVTGVVPTLTVTGNSGPGFFVLRDAFVRLREGTTISGNAGPGLLVDGSNVAVRNATITGNNNGQGDVVLSFYSGATFDNGNTFGTPLNCDGTSHARGQFQCSPTH
jgi:hypothetical protein